MATSNNVSSLWASFSISHEQGQKACVVEASAGMMQEWVQSMACRGFKCHQHNGTRWVKGQIGKRNNGSSCEWQYEDGRAGGRRRPGPKKDVNVGKNPHSKR